MTMELVKYDAALAALAEARSVDDVIGIIDIAKKIEAYGRILDDRQIENDAREIKKRARRKLGQLMKAQKKSVGMHKGGRPKKKTGSEGDPVSEAQPPTLSEARIGKYDADLARKEAAKSEEQHEAEIVELRAAPAATKRSRRTSDHSRDVNVVI